MASKCVACLFVSGGRGRRNLRPLAEACYRFSPQIAIREDEAIFLEVSASRKLFPGESLAMRLRALARRFAEAQGWVIHVALAESAAEALALARFAPEVQGRWENAWRTLPLEALALYAEPFKRDRELEKRLAKRFPLFEKLGLKTLGEFAALPPQGLAARFGRELLELNARVWGELEPAWPGFHPEPRMRERADTDGVSLSAILFVLKGLIDRAAARLRGRALRAARVQVDFELGAERKRSWQLEFPVPQGSAAGMLPVLQERLGFDLERRPLADAVRGLVFEVLETAPGRGAQRDFFRKKEEDAEAREALVARLSQKARVFFARPVDRYRPEAAYEPTLEPAPRVGAGSGVPPPPERPLRLLQRPEALQRKGGSLLHVASGRCWPVLEWRGPERMTGEWWDGGFQRDYFRVLTATDRLWVFSNARGYWLHGYFD